MDVADYRAFTQALAGGLKADARVVGLVAVGSMAERDYAPDEWSDHDFFVLTRPGEQEAFRSDLSWLPRAGVLLDRGGVAERLEEVAQASAGGAARCDRSGWRRRGPHGRRLHHERAAPQSRQRDAEVARAERLDGRRGVPSGSQPAARGEPAGMVAQDLDREAVKHRREGRTGDARERLDELPRAVLAVVRDARRRR